MPTDIPHFVNGTRVAGRGSRTQPVFNPRVHASILFIPTIGRQAALMSPVSRGEAGSRSRNLSEIGPRHRIADRNS
jgi:hypothetical protein